LFVDFKSDPISRKFFIPPTIHHHTFKMANRKFKYDTHEDEMFLRIVKDPKHSGLTKPTYDYVFNGYKEAYANHKDYKDPAPEWHHYYAEKQVWKFYCKYLDPVNVPRVLTSSSRKRGSTALDQTGSVSAHGRPYDPYEHIERSRLSSEPASDKGNG
jgi:hypothetical protein